jgi:hypothetical protein
VDPADCDDRVERLVADEGGAGGPEARQQKGKLPQATLSVSCMKATIWPEPGEANQSGFRGRGTYERAGGEQVDETPGELGLCTAAQQHSSTAAQQPATCRRG